MSLERRQAIWRIAAIILVIGLSAAIFLIPPEQTETLERFGLLGVFVITALANATLFLPAPGLLIVFTMGARLNPLGVGLAAATGATIGELSGYLAGYSGQAVVEDTSMYKRMVAWMQRNGRLTVLLLAFFPNPFFDLTGIAAGALKMSLRTFIIWCWYGKFGKMLITALAGAGFISIPWVVDWLN
jgi:uncharacterized membrane protein YdjX (TVP38/TMEM64 family)